MPTEIDRALDYSLLLQEVRHRLKDAGNYLVVCHLGRIYKQRHLVSKFMDGNAVNPEVLIGVIKGLEAYQQHNQDHPEA